MVGSDIISTLREGVLYDNALPFLWSNSLLEKYLNEAEKEACRRADLLIDSTTINDSGPTPLPLCKLNVIGGTATYSLSRKIIRILKATPSWNSIPLVQKTEGWLDELYPTWRPAEGNPIYFIEDKGKITLVPGPVSNDSQSVSSITSDGGIATVTLGDHKYITGNSVDHDGADQAEYNITEVITKVDDDTYTYPITGDPASPATGTITATLIDTLEIEVSRLPLDDMSISVKSVTGITRVGALATANLPSHDYLTDDIRTIEGADQAEYNVTETITKIDDDNFSYSVSGTPATATGTITSAASDSPEIDEEYHLGLMDWIAYLALKNHDKDTENAGKSNLHDAQFTRQFGKAVSAKTESNRRRRPRNKGFRSKEFGFS